MILKGLDMGYLKTKGFDSTRCCCWVIDRDVFYCVSLLFALSIFTRKVKQVAGSVDSKRTWYKILTLKLSSLNTSFILRYRPQRDLHHLAAANISVIRGLYPLKNEKRRKSLLLRRILA